MPADQALDDVARRLVQALTDYASDAALDNADAVIAARLAVFDAFVAAGWVAPTARSRVMERDRELLRQQTTLAETQPVPYPTPSVDVEGSVDVEEKAGLPGK